MNAELKKVKKLYGEEMMHFCRDNFALVLETTGLLLDILISNFNPTHELYKDLNVQNKLIDFKNFILKKVFKEEEENVQVNETPEELMAKAGYDMYECLSEEEIQAFRKYYAKGEELCTFWGNRLQKDRVFFAVKKDVDKIKREDFSKPSRQDLYGTSVISIQFTKDGTNTLSIKNRYNHIVDFPDSTFSNNLDNIIPGLTDSFERFYGLKQRYKNDELGIDGYIRANDGKYYKYNYEINNIYYCPDNIIIDNFEVKRYPKEQYLILDYFILDLEKKKIKFYDFTAIDSFTDTIGKIEKIEIRSTKEGKEILITPSEGEVIEIQLDKLNRIIGYKNNNVMRVYYFLYLNKCLRYLEMNSLNIIGRSFLYNNLSLKELNLPKVKIVSDNFLPNNKLLESISMPKLYQVGNNFLRTNDALKTINLPNLEIICDHFLENNHKLKTVILPNLCYVGNCFLYHNQILRTLYLPKLEEARDNFLAYNNSLERVDLTALESVGIEFLEGCNESLKIFIAPKLKVIGELEPLAFYERHPNLQEFVVANMEPILILKRH